MWEKFSESAKYLAHTHCDYFFFPLMQPKMALFCDMLLLLLPSTLLKSQHLTLFDCETKIRRLLCLRGMREL